jgi:WD40 repeat protein
MTAASPLTAAVVPATGAVSPRSLLGSSSFLLGEYSAKGPIFSVAIANLTMFVGYHNGIIGGFSVTHVLVPPVTSDSGPLVETNVAVDDERAPAPTLEMAAHSGVVRQLTVHEATQRLYSCSSDGSIKSWTIPECAWVMSFEAPGGTPVHCFVLDVKGTTLYSGDEAGAVTMWDVDTGVATQTMRCHYGAIHALQIPMVAPASKPAEGEAEAPEEEQEPPPRPNCLLTASSDGQIKLIEPSTKLIHVLMKADAPVCCLHYAHPNVLAGCSDGTIRGFNIHSAAPTMIYRGHKDGVNQLLVIRKRLVSVSDDTTIGIWNPRSWNRELTLQGHDRCVSSALVAPSGNALLTAGFDGVVRTWNVAAAMDHLTATGETVVAPPKKKKKPEGKASKKKK